MTKPEARRNDEARMTNQIRMFKGSNDPPAVLVIRALSIDSSFEFRHSSFIELPTSSFRIFSLVLLNLVREILRLRFPGGDLDRGGLGRCAEHRRFVQRTQLIFPGRQ